MRSEPSILHLDLDAFFAAVEQRDKPSLRGKPVVVGGLGPRGVVSTASYEARAFGIGSAMRTVEARARCPHAAHLGGRFAVYRQASRAVMRALAELSESIEPLSLDEAYVDLAVPGAHRPDGDRDAGWSVAAVEQAARTLKARVHAVTGGLTASVGAGSSKLIAKIASDLGKPDGLVVVPPGTETELLRPMAVTTIPGVGPATAERLRTVGVHTVGDLDRLGEGEMVALLGNAHGKALAQLARAEDPRRVESHRASKSVSVEDTFDRDISDPVRLHLVISRMAARVAERLSRSELSGRTVTVKVRLFDFTTHTRSATLPGPTDDRRQIARLAQHLLGEVETSAGVRLLGVGVSGLADWVQDDLFGPEPDADGRSTGATESGHADTEADPDGVDTGSVATDESAEADESSSDHARRFTPGEDVWHREHGPGWVWGSGLGRVTVRFETAETGPGPVRTLRTDDPDLGPYTPIRRLPR